MLTAVINPNPSQDNVPEQVEKYGAQSLIDKLSSLSQKYRLYETKLVKTRQSLEQKIPDVRRALKAVSALEARNKRPENGSEPVESSFELSDGIFVRASIPPTTSVCLWLGANVMVEYTFEEAVSLLQNNLKAAENNLNETKDNLNYLRDQLNTTDINLSRVYNFHVQSVRKSTANVGK